MHLLTLFDDYHQGLGYLSFSNHWKISKHIIVVCIHFLNQFKQQDILEFLRGYVQLMFISSFRINKYRGAVVPSVHLPHPETSSGNIQHNI